MPDRPATRGQSPAFATRTGLAGAESWLVGHSPAGSWRACDAESLLRNYLRAAIAQLHDEYPGGFLGGLLPYPAPPGSLNKDSTPALLMLFRECDRQLPVLPAASGFRLETPFHPVQRQQDYVGSVDRILAYLTSGDAYQVNLAQRFDARYSGDPWHAFLRVQSVMDAQRAAWITDGGRSVLCFSPESFLDVCNGRVVTHPIKGTRPRGATPEIDRHLAAGLATHPKDRAENLMIVDLLRNDLGKVCRTGSIRATRLFDVETHANVHHLVSTVEGRLDSLYDLADLLLACFPGGSITGAPKKRAMEIIAELEPVPRDAYCGSFFWLTADGRFGSNIAIRTFVAREGNLSGWAGAGIVADSIPAAEHRECLDKLGAIMSAFESL